MYRSNWIEQYLVCEDPIQKIRSPHKDLPEVDFVFHTEHHKAQEYHDRNGGVRIVRYELSETEEDDSDKENNDLDNQDDNQDFWDNLDEEAYHNLDNAMEG